MCVSCHLDSVEAPRTEGPRMTDEMGDTWRRTRTVDFNKNDTYDKTCENKKNKRNTSTDIPFCFVLNQMRLIKKRQPGMKEAQMVTSEEAPGLLDRIRIGGRMTTARASDDGDHSCFLFFSGVAGKRKSKYFRFGIATDKTVDIFS